MSQQPLIPDVVALQKAMLCVNCDMITESTKHSCGVCGSPSLLSLSRLLGGVAMPDASAVIYDEGLVRRLLAAA
jgi:hypothetical protein